MQKLIVALTWLFLLMNGERSSHFSSCMVDRYNADDALCWGQRSAADAVHYLPTWICAVSLILIDCSSIHQRLTTDESVACARIRSEIDDYADIILASFSLLASPICCWSLRTVKCLHLNLYKRLSVRVCDVKTQSQQPRRHFVDRCTSAARTTADRP